MTDLSLGYQPPGVFVDTQSTGAVAAVGITDTIIALIGDGIGHETNTENISFASANSIPLSKLWIDTSSVIVSAVMDDGSTEIFVVGNGSTNDYSLTTTNHITSVVRRTAGTIPTDRPIKVVYNFADDGYFGLNKFTDYQTFVQIYGQPLNPTTGAVVSPLSFAAQKAFQNGANVIYAVALDARTGSPTKAEQFQTAYSKLMPNFDINVIVPLWTDGDDSATVEGYLADLSNFLDNSVIDGFPMIAIVGVAAGYATNDPEVLAANVENRRIILVWPNQLYYFNTVLNRSTAIADGIYFAAACAGALANQPINRGLTRTPVKGSFTGIPPTVLNTMTTSKKNSWSSQGVSVAEIDRLNRLIIRHGVTTDMSNVGTREISIVRCQDAIMGSIQLSLENADLIGDPINVDTSLMVSSIVDGALQSLLAEGVMQNYTDVVVQQGPDPDNNPTVMKVSFSYKPTYPMNYIQVSFTLDLTTNTITTSTDTTVTV